MDGKEKGTAQSGGVVGPFDVDSEANLVVNVDIHDASGVDRDVDDQLQPLTKGNVRAQVGWGRDHIGFRGMQCLGIPVIVLKDGTSQITDGFGDDAPFKGARRPPKCEAKIEGD